MTAVASPPSLQPLPRLGWNSSSSGSQGGLDSMSTAEVTRMLARKSPQRTNSSSSVTSNSSTSSTASDSTIHSKDPKIRPPRGQGGDWMNTRNAPPWNPPETPEAVALPDSLNGRPPAIPQLLPGPLAQPPMAALHQPAPVVPSQKSMQPPQANGVRVAPTPQNVSDPPAVLALLPMNGTFERKQINVPLFPEILRIGRQTNAKTVPTPSNGYFDSKVLSRQHAEVWADRNGKIWIRDVKSSNGTFVNGMRLSPESRDSEPHELRENDMLELGIDIVSEDQKSIVHHKVSAKIEHAGIHVNTSSVLDLNIGDIDPGSGGGIMGSMFQQQIAIRGRNGSQASVMSNGRIVNHNMGGNMNGAGVQRHMNAWLSPISIEQVVKRLGNELKQAKQQASDLHRTNDFFNAVLTTQPGQEMPKPPGNILSQPMQTNGVASPKRVDPISPFSEPPAPPPQQPLPEKPDVRRSIDGEANLLTSLKRVDTEKPLLQMMTSSPTKADVSSSQILSLAEALAATRKELENQGIRVRHLEETLKQERRARESAEERARHLLERSKLAINVNGLANKAIEILPDKTPRPDSVATFDSFSEADSSASDDTLAPSDKALDGTTHEQTNHAEHPATKTMQDRLTRVLSEMDELKTQMELYKRRVESSESERDGLVEMVIRLREEASAKPPSGSSRKRRTSSPDATSPHSTSTNGFADHSHVQNGVLAAGSSVGDANGAVVDPGKQLQQLRTAVNRALSARDERMLQSAPYVSILGVVLLGVGIMTYLNGLQQSDP